MTRYVFGLAKTRSFAGSHTLMARTLTISAAGCMAVLLVGCAGSDSATSTTSNDDIAAFIDENPEYADSGPTTAEPSRPSRAAPLGLER